MKYKMNCETRTGMFQYQDNKWQKVGESMKPVASNEPHFSLVVIDTYNDGAGNEEMVNMSTHTSLRTRTLVEMEQIVAIANPQAWEIVYYPKGHSISFETVSVSPNLVAWRERKTRERNAFQQAQTELVAKIKALPKETRCAFADGLTVVFFRDASYTPNVNFRAYIQVAVQANEIVFRPEEYITRNGGVQRKKLIDSHGALVAKHFDTILSVWKSLKAGEDVPISLNIAKAQKKAVSKK